MAKIYTLSAEIQLRQCVKCTGTTDSSEGELWASSLMLKLCTWKCRLRFLVCLCAFLLGFHSNNKDPRMNFHPIKHYVKKNYVVQQIIFQTKTFNEVQKKEREDKFGFLFWRHQKVVHSFLYLLSYFRSCTARSLNLTPHSQFTIRMCVPFQKGDKILPR